MAGPFVGHFRTVVESLFGDRFTDGDGIPEAELDARLGRVGYEVPEALQDFYAVVGCFDPVLQAYNRFYPLDRFELRGGWLVFCEENQVVAYWGYDQDQGWRTDPPVYQGINGDAIEWYVEPGTCSEFLMSMIYWQALNGALPHVRFGDASEAVCASAQAWPLVYRDDDSEWYSCGGLVFSLTRQDGEIEVQAASGSESELDELWQALGLK